MKADLKISQKLVVMVILAILIVVFFAGIFTAKVEPLGYSTPIEKVECKQNSDCLEDQICTSINGQSTFCACFDDTDCQGKRCVNMRCVS